MKEEEKVNSFATKLVGKEKKKNKKKFLWEIAVSGKSEGEL